MSAFGRLLTSNFAGYWLIERPLSVRADIQPGPKSANRPKAAVTEN